MTARRAATGGRIDRTRTVRFTFDGRPFTGHAGDTLASALMAAGVGVVGRSFKYHRPRGIFAAGVDEPSALVTLLDGATREPNVPATGIEIFDGLVAESQNRFPSLAFDLGAINQLGGPALAAGFYYKTFMGPVAGPLKGTRFWMFCEKFIRRAAGLGRAGYERDPARYERVNAFCDLLVVGAGPAGLASARAAAEAGADVILAELDPVAGGSAKWSASMVDGLPAHAWAARETEALRAMPNVRVVTRTAVWGAYDGTTFAATQQLRDRTDAARHRPRDRSWTIRARSALLATGAFERPLVFPGNDRPGVMLADAALRYAREYAVLPGERIVLFGNNDTLYRAAAGLAEAGCGIAALVDVRTDISPTARALADRAGGRLLLGHAVVSTEGRKGLRAIAVRRYDAARGAVVGPAEKIAADCLAVSGGWSPAVHLASQGGAQPVWDGERGAFVLPRLPAGWVGAGAVVGDDSLAAVLEGGHRAVRTALGGDIADFVPPEVEEEALDATPAGVFEIRVSGKAFVDLQHDVTSDDVRLAHREGFVSVEHLKRYTTLGMATDQGKTSNVPGIAIMAEALAKPMSEVGTTRFRPPFVPVSIGSIAAERQSHLRPERLTPMHDWHVEHGATMLATGLWFRPQIYGEPGETVEQAYVREARAVRQNVGIVDVSTLGKIAVQGPDAGAFLDRIYTNTFSTLPVGKARYGLMLREDGLVFDDGTTWRLGPDDFLMTTTTANAGKVMQHLEYFADIVWPDLKVALTSVTDQWAGAAIAGPGARDVLAACVTGTSVDNETLPFMGIVHGEVAGAPVMVCRLSFSGERAYEVYCGAGHGLHVWEALMEAGRSQGIVPYGLEALGTLRIEKGHVTGSEIDGRTTAQDLGLHWMLSKKKPFVGSAMMDREGLAAKDRLSLVGLVALDGRSLGNGGQIVEHGDRELRDSIGHVTANCFSPALGKYIALALVKAGSERIGSRAFVSDPLRGRFGPVEIVSHHFFDPEGSRMHG